LEKFSPVLVSAFMECSAPRSFGRSEAPGGSKFKDGRPEEGFPLAAETRYISGGRDCSARRPRSFAELLDALSSAQKIGTVDEPPHCGLAARTAKVANTTERQHSCPQGFLSFVIFTEMIKKTIKRKTMKHCIRYTCPVVIVAGTLIASFALAEDKSASEKADPNMEEMMKKAEAAGTPGAPHQALEPLVGNWTAEVKSWMAPGAPPTVTKARAKSSWVMDGRFVQQEFTGEFMGKPFRGVSLTGYDNTQQKYNSVWIDDMHTSMFTSEGEGENGKVITFEGKYDCPMTGRKDLPVKQVLQIVSHDKHVFEMLDPTNGDSKTMEITYTRE
jgi:Protein of unknown function (DUF1579)